MTKRKDAIDHVANGVRVKKMRKKLRITAQAVCDEIRKRRPISAGYYSLLESGKRSWTVKLLRAVDDALKKLSEIK